MKEIEQIYHNELGVAFHWKKNDTILKDRIQIVFKETGFYLSLNEVKAFVQIIEDTCKELNCNDCCYNNTCRKFLLKTPLAEIDLAVSKGELLQIQDLMQGTVFNVQLGDYITKVCR